MMLNALIDHIDDRLNPIVVKELRQAVKSRMVIAILLLFLGIQLFILGLNLIQRQSYSGIAEDWNAGNVIFRAQHLLLLWTIMIVVPAYAAVRLGAERSDQNVDLMFVSTLRPASIISGKLFASFILGLLIFSTCAPFMTFTYLLRGIDIPTILTVLGIDLLALLYGLMVALLSASIPGNRALKFLFAFLAFLYLIIVCASLLTPGTWYLVEFGGGQMFENLEVYWIPIALTVVGALAHTAQLYFYSVCLISPPSANRVLPMRIYLFAAFVVMGAGCFLAYYFSPATADMEPVALFIVFATYVLLVQFVISICERDRWGPRITRTIPRNPLLRAAAFFFYTGAAGGILFTTGLLLVTFGAGFAWLETSGGASAAGMPHRHDAMWSVLATHGVLALYVYCYGMSAVVVRAYLLADQLRPAYTWLVAALLVGLGSAVPPILSFIFFRDEFGNWGQDAYWTFLPNPFYSVFEFGSRWRSYHNDFQEVCLWFLGVWTLLVTVLAIPWMMRQVAAFRPQKTRPAPLPDLVLDAEILPAPGVN